MRVLVLGAGGPAGLNVTKALYDAGHETVAVEVDPVTLQVSRGRFRELVEPDRDPQVINDLIEEYEVGMVHAQPDAEVQWLARYQHELLAPTLLPDRATLFVAADKLRTAECLWPDAPRSLALSESTDIAEAIDELGGDCWLRLRSGAGSAGALPVSDAEIARAWLRHHGRPPEEWMLSERLPGKDLSFTGVYRDGKLLAFGMKERLRLHGASRSPARVASTANLQVTVNRQDVRNVAYRATEALPGEPNGVLMFDMREDANGVPRVTECNAGRFGTTSMHWSAAGLSLVGIYAEAVRGEPMSRTHQVPAGVAWYRELDSGAQKVKL